MAFTNFAGESTIDNSNSRVAIARKPLGNANGKNKTVEHGKRTQDLITSGIENFVGSGDFAEFFTALFNNAESVAVEQFASTFVGKLKNNFSEFVVDFDASSGRTETAGNFLDNGERIFC